MQRNISVTSAARQRTGSSRARRTRGDVIFDTMNFIFMVLMLILFAYPLYFVLIASVSDPMSVNAGKVIFLPKDFMWVGYQRVFAHRLFLRSYLNTIEYTFVGTCLNVALTISSGYVLSRRDLPFRVPITILFMITMFFNGGMIPDFLLVKNLGMYNTFFAMVIPNALSVWNVMLAKSYFSSSLPGELLEASEIDGCGNLRFFFSIAVPLANALTAVMVLFYAVGHWNSYMNSLIYLQDAEKQNLQQILRQILIVEQGNNAEMAGGNMSDYAERMKASEQLKYALIVVSSLPMMVVYPFVQKHFVKGVMVGSIKG